MTDKLLNSRTFFSLHKTPNTWTSLLHFPDTYRTAQKTNKTGTTVYIHNYIKCTQQKQVPLSHTTKITYWRSRGDAATWAHCWVSHLANLSAIASSERREGPSKEHAENGSAKVNLKRTNRERRFSEQINARSDASAAAGAERWTAGRTKGFYD